MEGQETHRTPMEAAVSGVQIQLDAQSTPIVDAIHQAGRRQVGVERHLHASRWSHTSGCARE